MRLGNVEIQITGISESSTPLFHATQTADGVRHIRHFGRYKTWTVSAPRISNAEKITIEALSLPAELELDDGYRCYADAAFSWTSIGYVSGTLYWEASILLTEVAND